MWEFLYRFHKKIAIIIEIRLEIALRFEVKKLLLVQFLQKSGRQAFF
jgi:hypothetical protein